MEEIDTIIFRSLRIIGCSLADDGVRSLNALHPDELVPCIVRCLQLIQPDEPATGQLPLTWPPANVAQRFSVSSAIADACRLAGYRGEIGYQTFLYVNVPEVRRVIMFLIERLPKGTINGTEASVDGRTTDRLVALKRRMAVAIQQHFDAGWTTFYCRSGGERSTNGSLLDAVVRNETSAQPGSAHSPSVFQQTDSAQLTASLLHANALQQQQRLPHGNAMLERRFQKMLSIRAAQTCDSSIEATDSEPVAIDQQGSLSLAIKQLLLDINAEAQRNRKHTAETAEQRTIRTQAELELNALAQRKRLAQATAILLEHTELSVPKMTEVLAASRARKLKLQTQWDAYRGEQLREVENCQQALRNSAKSKLLLQIAEERERHANIGRQLSANRDVHGRLLAELRDQDATGSREAYTSRILEIIENIRRQRVDIDKVLGETRMLQKTLNTTAGQLDRQYSVTDDLLFKNAKRNEHAKLAYKNLSAMHAYCVEILRNVESSSAVVREIRELEDQLDADRMRSLAVHLQRITDDLQLVKREGAGLAQLYRKRIAGT